jgi:hypothetical protein
MTPGRDVKGMPGKKTILLAFSPALAREAHVLTPDPGLLWQQLWGQPRIVEVEWDPWV